MSLNVLVTGANGFIGRYTCQALHTAGHQVLAVQRHVSSAPWQVMNWPADGQWDLQGVDAVVHLAAITQGPEEQLQAVNVDITRALALACERDGVKHLIFVSSIGVCGAGASHPLVESSAYAPQNAYTRSKAVAENELRTVLQRCNWSIVRPPLVYGAEAKGSFALLLRLVNSGLPLPFAGLKAPRSMVYVEHLAELLVACVEKPAANNIFHVADEPALPVADVIRELQTARRRYWHRLIPVPATLLTTLAALAGKTDAVQQLSQPLLVDSSKARRLLNWHPQLSTREALQRCVQPVAEPGWQRIVDCLLASSGLALLWPLMCVMVLLNSLPAGQPLFRQQRLGRQQRLFTMVKFRTMALDTPSVPTHELKSQGLTPLGRFLRKSKFDELPQLWNVLRGDMSLVGARPGLPGHTELTVARLRHGVFDRRPGITGLAQLQGIDMSTPEKLAATDAAMYCQLTPCRYLQYIALTALPPLKRWWPL